MENTLFLLKKFLAGLLMPLPLILLLQIWALLLLLRRKTRWLGILILVLTTSLLFVASYAPLSAKLTTPFERQYASYHQDDRPVDFVVVLGNGHVSDPGLPVTSELSAVGIVRLCEGIRIYRLNPGSKLVFTGYHASDPVSYAEKIKELALALGVPGEDILAFTGPKDTAEEALLVAERFADNRLVLVTSASHMPRALGLFRKAGLDPIPAPTNHLARPVSSNWVFPKAETLARTQTWAYEQLGLVWAKLLGQISEEK